MGSQAQFKNTDAVVEGANPEDDFIVEEVYNTDDY